MIHVSGGVTTYSDTAQKLTVEAEYYLPPVELLVGEEPIEHVFLAVEHLAEGAVGIVRGSLHREERQQNQPFYQLDEGEFAVRILNRSYLLDCMTSRSIMWITALFALLAS